MLERSEVAPKPPFLEADFSPVNHPRWTPGPRVSDPKWRPAGGISGSIGRGASSAEGKQSYGVQPEFQGSALAADLHGEIVREHVGLLMCDTAGF